MNHPLPPETAEHPLAPGQRLAEVERRELSPEALAEIRALVAQGRSFLPSLDSGERGRVPAELRRLLKPISAFPALARELRPHLAAFPDWIRERIEARMRRRR